MNFLGGQVGGDRTSGDAGMEAALARIDIFKSERIVAHVRRVGIATEAEVGVVGLVRKKKADVTGEGVVTIHGVGRFAEERESVEVGPALAESAGLRVPAGDANASANA